MRLSAFERECEGALTRAEAENWGYRRLLQYLAEAAGCTEPRRQPDSQAGGFPQSWRWAERHTAIHGN